jgi:hypothetical protein
MLKSITLKNFKSFGNPQEVPLEPITVLVGPNNSGKSNLLSVGALVRSILGIPAGAVGVLDGIRHALFAVDNDGGARRGPEHKPNHDQPTQAADDDGCRTCRILQAIPEWWTIADRRHCAAVPVQPSRRGSCASGATPSTASPRGLMTAGR